MNYAEINCQINVKYMFPNQRLNNTIFQYLSSKEYDILISKVTCTLVWLGAIITFAWRPRQNGRYFADDIFRRIFFNENVCISIKISLKFVPKGPINNIAALVQIMAWRRPGDKPLSESMLISLPTHICITRPQWVNSQQGLESI